ncbi:iron ascorbate-dependent oxidoreductase [Aureococcus anophagefferens]|nr:iron ascorbate-dependent oxidoreductase [Aureococcus anophagefferens]
MAAVLDDVNLERGLRATMTRDATTGRVPVIDMSADDAGARMWDAATTVGFFTVVNHGVDEETISAGFAASRAFFAQDQGEKERQSPFAPRLNSGYEYMTQVRPSTGTADRKESLQITAREGAMDGRWPATPATFEADARALLGASRAWPRGSSTCSSAARLAGTLSGSHALWGAGGQCCLRLLHYPPADAVAADDATTWRAGPHTDWCCVTLLYQRPGNEGLERGRTAAARPRPRGSAWTPSRAASP